MSDPASLSQLPGSAGFSGGASPSRPPVRQRVIPRHPEECGTGGGNIVRSRTGTTVGRPDSEAAAQAKADGVTV